MSKSTREANQSTRVQELPAQLTRFIGRERELLEIGARLADPACRLLTLVGPGGVGKTRLAIEAAHQQANRLRDGLAWVDLQPVGTGELLVTAVADAFSLSLSGHTEPRQQVLRYLEDKAVLLVLDNFEQLSASADFLSDVLQHGPEVKLLVTSRTALHLQEEWLYPVTGLPYPRAAEKTPAWSHIEGSDAVQLFVERVRRVRPGFSPQEEKTDILRICQLVEGMPLALELAAAWARSLDCATIAAEIERNLTFLTSSWSNVSERHRSMRAVFAHSWALLGPSEQAVFPQLAVFRGGFRREAAEVVVGATLPLLTTLVDNSLLRWQANGRYRMHELLRQYARDRLARSTQDTDQSRERHAAYYLEFLRRRRAAILGGSQREAAIEISAELDNIRKAWRFAVQHQMVAEIGRGIGPLSMFMNMNGRYLDAARMFDQALDNLEFTDGSTRPVEELVLLYRGWIAIRLGQFEMAEQLFQDCWAIHQSLNMPFQPGEGTDPRLGLSVLASIHGEYAEAGELARQAYQSAVAQDHFNNQELANYQLASVAYAQGDYESAQAYAEAAYASCQQTGDEWFMAYCLGEMGRAARALGDYASARRHFEAGYDLRESFSDPEGMALALYNLGDVALREDRVGEAQDLFERSASLYRKINDIGGLAAACYGLGRTALARGDIQASQSQLGQALAIAARINFAPLLLAILSSVGQFFLETGRVEQGFALLALVLEQPAAYQETKSLAQQMLQHYQASVSPAMAAGSQRALSLEAATATAQSELAAAIPPHTEKSPGFSANAVLVEPLTERELEVLGLIALGLTNREIAEQLSVVIGTVKAHNNSIYGKLGVKNRASAVARARELGLIS